MKTAILITAMFLTAGLASPVAADPKLPFSGSMEASESYTDFGQPPILFFVNAGGTATTTRLGQFTMAYTFMVDYVSDAATVGRARFIAANGDNIFTTCTGIGSPPVDNVASIVEMHTITGGTGHFAGAKGEFTVRRLVTFGPDGTTGTTAGSIDGTIKLKKH